MKVWHLLQPTVLSYAEVMIFASIHPADSSTLPQGIVPNTASSIIYGVECTGHGVCSALPLPSDFGAAGSQRG